MKKLLAAACFIFIQFACFAQIRNSICIVRPNYSDKLVEDMLEFVPRFEKLGIPNAEERINEFIESGSSGSGFVYVAPDGKNYIITNRHVISDAETSTVSFVNDEGEVSYTYSGLTILAADAECDLAILAFPNDERPFAKSIPLSNTKIEDGDSVYTAGFPGLLGKPSWQFGSGIVTNSSIKVPALINPDISPVIQHSAQIDAGNSGGPLLVKNKEGTYEIVGVNAWKITNRQDTNFSIPVKTLKRFIDKAIAGERMSNMSSEDMILDQAVELQKILNRFEVTFEELIGYISIDFIEAEGKAIYDIAYAHSNDNNRKTLKEMLVNYSPIMGMRYAIGWDIYTEFHKDEFKKTYDQKSSVPEDQLPEVPTPIQYEESDIWYTSYYLKYTNSYAKSEWVYSNGGWGLYSFKKTTKGKLGNITDRNLKKSDKQKKAVSSRKIPDDRVFYTPNWVTIGYGGLFPPKDTCGHNIDLDVKLINILALDFTCVLNENIEPILYYNQKNPVFTSYEAYGGVQLQFPITKVSIQLVPYITVQGGGVIAKTDSLTFEPVAKADAGGRFCLFMGSSNVNLFVDAAAEIKMNFKTMKPVYGCLVSTGFSF